MQAKAANIHSAGQFFHLGMAKAVRRVIVHHAYSLGESIDDGGAAEFEAAGFEVF